MKHKALLRMAFAVLSLMLMPPFAVSQEQPQGISIGVGATRGLGIYVGEDNTATVLPLLRYDTEAFSIGVPDGLRVTVLDQNAFRLSALITARPSTINASDAQELDGLERKLTADGGFQASYRFGKPTELRLQAMTELTHEHSGGELSLSLSQAFPLGRVPLMLQAGVTWQSKELTSYLYGVSSTESTDLRPVYSSGDVVIPHLSVTTVLSIARNTRLITSIGADFLPDEISISPIVNEDVAVHGFLGIIHNF